MALSVKEEAQKLRQNLDRVYTAGVASATSGELMTDINDALVTKGVETAETLEQVPQRINEIDYLPNPLLYVENTNRLFNNVVFPDGYEIQIVAPNHKGNLELMFYAVKGIRKITLDVPKGIVYSFYQFARDNSCVEEIVLPDGINITSWNYFVYFASALRKIIGRIDLTGNTTNTAALTNANSLEEVYFMPNTIEASISITSSKLIDASVESTIEGLVDLTGQTAQKVQFHTDVLLKLTEEQFSTIHAKNWTT